MLFACEPNCYVELSDTAKSATAATPLLLTSGILEFLLLDDILGVLYPKRILASRLWSDCNPPCPNSIW